jgi:hypothetical protein
MNESICFRNMIALHIICLLCWYFSSDKNLLLIYKFIVHKREYQIKIAGPRSCKLNRIQSLILMRNITWLLLSSMLMVDIDDKDVGCMLYRIHSIQHMHGINVLLRLNIELKKIMSHYFCMFLHFLQLCIN